ncbi:Cysteine/Histidine-rich C1 domain family protein [Raphanus sativus]|uniref:Uncharacterized protein LOC108808141 n=1 Tax=Raphanus sativus TaxID=3726 RepID=A0A6J0MYN5_RAPSA|nr:uncharacterized protein LOC108848378 [Raphanus sativus]XP_056864654.1 uncharacterized protein LOC108808141 [Raphanus sativus]KAJ4868838.1 Cysteine/Histidine-rich C1 domain family protein [Raphanus sativus]KAJ4900385.1 Cysteine/Histidine-rich C1 domain family protein [Raphanus sativus]
MDSGGKQISMERVELPQLHEHPLVPFSPFVSSRCKVCSHFSRLFEVYIYGGYRCNELGCGWAVFHKDCANPLKEINHSFHPDHPLKLIIATLPLQDSQSHTCFCGRSFKDGYCCAICDFKLCLVCARRQEPLVLPENSYGGHEHPLKIVCDPYNRRSPELCKACVKYLDQTDHHYRCQECEEFAIHIDCLELFPEAYHMTSHPQHPLKSLRGHQVPDYADKNCLLCEKEFDQVPHHQLHHCDVCNVSICSLCMIDPPPVEVECMKTHEHQLHLVPRLIDFTCNACGTQGNRSPYFCLPCNFMIHRECIDLPRVININRHDHRISYTPRLGHGEWKCRVCRKEVVGFYGAYTCSKCPTFSVHARCATREDVWDMVEREGTPEEEEEEEIPPYQVIDDNTVKHFSHDHNLQLNKDGVILSENTLCKACIFQISSEPFYICKQHHCGFILHEKCANLPRKKRHVCNNLPFTLHTDSHYKFQCWLCYQHSSGFRYESGPFVTIDVGCASTSDLVEHESHPHPLYYCSSYEDSKPCSRCKRSNDRLFSCDECEYDLDGKCAILPEKVMKNRYDDHPLLLSYGDMDVDDEKYWCESCETKVDPKEGFYACNDCGVVLHISCVLGDFSYIMPGSFVSVDFTTPGYVYISEGSMTSSDEEVVSNTSICRPFCAACNSRCKLPSVLKVSKDGVVVCFCSLKCRYHIGK